MSVTTPLMVPSFSSKGFSRSSQIGGSNKDGFRSLLHKTLVSASEFIDRSYLISAFDVDRGYLPPVAELTRVPEIVFLDSGGYEISDYQDFSEIEETSAAAGEWTTSQLRTVHDAWPAEVPVVLISFDHPKQRSPFAKQIASARELFRGNEKHLRSFLLKPETETARTLRDVLKVALVNVDQFAFFSIVGVTEWELGTCTLDRMENIARLRRAMDAAGQQHIPLHIFGALDPLSTILYFLCGAEIFDGLTWLRYGYADARCVYRNNHATLSFALDVRDDDARAQMITNNYYYLRKLALQLHAFASSGGQDFSKLQPHDNEFRPVGFDMAGFLTKAMDMVNTRLTVK